MREDFEGTINLDQMDDEAIGDLVRQRLDEDNDFDVDDVEIDVSDGRISVEGRVGTEGERQHVAQVLTGLGSQNFDNNVMVDENVRAQRSDAADVAQLEDDAIDAPMGEPGKTTSDTAEHLMPDDEGDMNGTHDMQKAIQQGQSYNPPDGPVQEGHGDGETH